MFHNGLVCIFVLLQAVNLSSAPFNYFGDFWKPPKNLTQFVLNTNKTHPVIPPIVPPVIQHVVNPSLHPVVDHVLHHDDHHDDHHDSSKDDVHVYYHVKMGKPPGKKSKTLYQKLLYNYIQNLLNQQKTRKTLEQGPTGSESDGATKLLVNLNLPQQITDSLMQSQGGKAPNSEYYKTVLDTMVMLLNKQNEADKPNNVDISVPLEPLYPELETYDSAAMHTGLSSSGTGSSGAEIWTQNSGNNNRNKYSNQNQASPRRKQQDKKANNRKLLDLDYEVIEPTEEEFNKNLVSLNKESLKENEESSRRKGGRQGARRSKRRSTSRRSGRRQMESEKVKENPVKGESRRSSAKDSSNNSTDKKTKDQNKT